MIPPAVAMNIFKVTHYRTHKQQVDLSIYNKWGWVPFYSDYKGYLYRHIVNFWEAVLVTAYNSYKYMLHWVPAAAAVDAAPIRKEWDEGVQPRSGVGSPTAEKEDRPLP